MSSSYALVRLANALALTALVSSAFGCGDDAASSGDDSEVPEGVAQSALGEATRSLNLTKDTGIRIGTPNKNYGSSATLDINRGLIEAQSSELSSVLGAGDYLLAAKLQFTLVPSDERRRQQPREVGLHRLLKPWTENGATWLCGNDSNTSNSRPDCGSSGWNPLLNNGTFVDRASSTVTVPASRTGSVAFDVTSDVRSLLANPAGNFGWVIKTNPGVLEFADFASSESATPPVLLLDVRHCEASACDDGDACTADTCDSESQCVHAPLDPASCLPPQVVLNEVESNGGTPGDWVELYNAGPYPTDLSGWRFKDNDDTHAFYVVPTGTTISTGGLNFAAWPGATGTTTVDTLAAFGGNLSGLFYEAATASTPNVLWAVQNNPSVLFRLVNDGTNWVPATTDGWDIGKNMVYPDGTGVPDSEGVTRAELDSPAIYVSTERNNSVSGVSRLSILRVDTSAAGSILTTTHEWNLTSDILPAVGANAGLEGIAWVPDDYLVATGFLDEHTGHLYEPSQYADHGSGLFFVGVEATGTIYAYALDHVGGGFTRIATITSGQPATMDLMFDRDHDVLWAYCDDTCGNRATLLRVSTDPVDLALGKFGVRAAFGRPATMPNINNEGIAIAPESQCTGGLRSFFWTDDGETDGHSLRTDTIACGPLF